MIPELRIGQGYDVHRLKPGKPLWLGGIEVPHTQGAVGHSDADVLIHTICDALLGAANLRDIGHHFPDTDPAYKGIDSKKLLKEVVDLVGKAGYGIVNIDSTIMLQLPKVNPHIPQMIKTLSGILKIEEDRLSIKATTTEKLSFVGREEGIAAQAVCLLYKID
jgi:2-C-methyl-D-erythritol 2,4-cyclodiphosphate synthase